MKSTQLLQSKAYDYLKDLILNDKLEHGVIYSQKKVAEELGISKTPLRDAVLRLEQERYIDVYPSKGFMIHEMMEDDIRETYQIRNAIETFCLKQLVADFDSPNAQKCLIDLRAKIKQQQNLIETNGSSEEFARIDCEFHQSIVEFLENTAMLHLYEEYMHRIFWQNVLSFTREGRMQETIGEHKGIMAALEKRDRAELEELLNRHLSVAENINLELIKGKA
ncbi:GntR family transcriptional regulator [Anaerostipes sp.]|uniref:GntR family transcriptional regulator n=1 Tax=Anaerostipes sp. TaxID=1872530 RepID=UPI0025C250C9|nr:GntR family transcriptional regulator [Anaerostipes sp.]MBS7006823.1 GntR family transcriptional regulator [Anaerostipes sp.]